MEGSMNHISKSFTSGDGRVYKSHSWETREGGYRRTALLAGNGLWPIQKETRLIGFLLDRGFRVRALDLAFGSPESPRTRLRSFREAFAAFARDAAPKGQPLYVFASSFSASALLPVAAKMAGIRALALVAPVVDFSACTMKMPLFFLPTAELAVKEETLSGSPELLGELFTGGATLKFHKRDLRTGASDIAGALEEGFALPVAAFAGEDDPFLREADRRALSHAGAKVYSYPRVRHEPGHDRYGDNYYADLGSFLDEVEAGRVKPKTT
jgi:alpha-beta hydrolase superfamily lysophospholipase